MAINLSKGQRVSLDKGVRLALVGLGWDTNRYDGSADFDLDASAFLLGANGKVRSDDDFIFYGNLQSKDGSVTKTILWALKSFAMILARSFPLKRH